MNEIPTYKKKLEMESYLGFWLCTLFRQEAAESGGKRGEVGGVVVLDENGVWDK